MNSWPVQCCLVPEGQWLIVKAPNSRCVGVFAVGLFLFKQYSTTFTHQVTWCCGVSSWSDWKVENFNRIPGSIRVTIPLKSGQRPVSGSTGPHHANVELSPLALLPSNHPVACLSRMMLKYVYVDTVFTHKVTLGSYTDDTSWNRRHERWNNASLDWLILILKCTIHIPKRVCKNRLEFFYLYTMYWFHITPSNH